MRYGTTRRTTPDDGPLEHAVRQVTGGHRAGRTRAVAYCGTRLAHVHEISFNRESPRACARCARLVGPEPTRP